MKLLALCLCKFAVLPSLSAPFELFPCAEVKSTETVGPVLIHIVTEKGRGYLPAESASDKMHGVGKYDPLTGKQQKKKGGVSRIPP